MKLNELASLIAVARVIGDGDISITGMEMDSRKVKPGDLFLCVPDFPNLIFQDRHQYAGEAIEYGAAAILTERILEVDVPQLLVKNVRYAMAVIANHYYGYASRDFHVIGVTGTNGKTTTTHIIEHILNDQGFKVGLMGNLGMKIDNQLYAYEGNTQEAPELQKSFQQMKEADIDCCVMEVSSHGLQLSRVLGTNFRTAVFTNLTQDHLDFHLSMEQYKAAKGLLFARLGNTFEPDFSKQKYAVLNADDSASTYFAEITSAQVVTYGIDNKADVMADNIWITSEGTQFHLTCFAGETDIQLKLIGKFNVYNALGAIAATLLEGVPLEQVKNSLEGMSIVPGRMEPVLEGQDFLVAVDYAHTPDGLENALSTIRGFVQGHLITVFGCGGDRDRTKRPLMGKIAAQYSDYVYITSDNPRTENPDHILLDIEPGLLELGFPEHRYEMIVDRRAAIKKAIEMASPNDVVLIAGKGHETYQIIGTIKTDFDDRDEARAAIRGLKT
ncbi:UDP-N-acetylmuramoyl-L-alanyl-D-glutamate--2,6-diaminopimelate ligase [Paenibacillus psychroresistens]|uniref:UDP-N-acetylmuramoyl-L-alanyl-D-glutamate--2,6-diaminopimelate ligase n=1 Tax=Paenibacillus psychroresistens TaxID=1778678 RepID=A0A6B8RJ63_9BACL|nr:UDP-N-acetylmuramoyl-L-alanyl-D-glutamate--2,6-diaminopimelate ligase [Paenibacillus psychroresistens]QGQ95774.1 UDP-N-acetylmuramoyl-L-alanyl-D-glutamate--2,6-diaminopimelate ligase [Paenibacillus psychroresistens]